MKCLRNQDMQFKYLVQFIHDTRHHNQYVVSKIIVYAV